MQSTTVQEQPGRYGRKNRARDPEQPWLYKKHWSESEYLALETNRLIEFNNGLLEILPMPTFLHQTMAIFLVRLFQDFLGDEGVVVCAPFRMKVPGNKYREADVALLLNKNLSKFGNEFWTGADLVVEIVSPGGEKRDKIEKRVDYAAALISEYWIIDPPAETIVVLKLSSSEYIEHAKFCRGERLNSPLLPGLEIDVSAVFDSGPKNLK